MATTTTNYFYSVERSGYLTVSSLFLDVLTDMTRGGAFEAINLSNNIPLPGDPVGYPYNAYTLYNYQATIITTNPISAPIAVGTKYYLPGTPALYSTGISKPRPYVLVTEVIDATNTVKSTGSGIVYSVSDVINGMIGTTATDWPLFDLTTETSMLGDSTATPPVGPATINLKTGDATGSTASLAAGPISVQFSRGTNPSIYSFTLEATDIIDALNGNSYGPNPNDTHNYGQDDDNPNKQPWRIQFVIPDPQQAQSSVAAPMQMSYDPVADRVTVAKITDDTGAIMDNVGSLGAWQPGGVLDPNDPKQGFINRKVRVADQSRTYPLSYMLSVSDHGFFLGVWEGNWSTQRAGVTKASNYFNWVAVQRPVNANSGRILTSGKSPVFAINGTDYLYYASVVREADVLHPSSGPSPIVGGGTIQISHTRPFKITGAASLATGLKTEFTTTWEPGTVIYSPGTGPGTLNGFIGIVKSIVNDTTAYLAAAPADAGVGNVPPSRYASASAYVYLAPNQTPYRTYADRHSDGHHMLFSSVNQVALTEDKTYLLTFPHNLTTPRFRYTEEIDMFGTTSADVVRSGQDIQFVTYGEWGPRTYRALPASSRDNTGMRIAAMRAPTGPAWIGVQTVDGQANASTMEFSGTAPNITYTGLGVSALERDTSKLVWPTSYVNVDPMPFGGNLSALTDNDNPTGGLVADYVLTPNRAWTPINLVAYPIQKVRTTDFSHLSDISYSITRGLEQLKALGLGIITVNNPVFPGGTSPLYWGVYVGQIVLEAGIADIIPVPYSEETIISFTVTAKNSANDGETPSGQNSMDFYFVYKPA